MTPGRIGGDVERLSLEQATSHLLEECRTIALGALWYVVPRTLAARWRDA